MRRRLDLAASLVTRPPVLFLDEPTTGLDPTSRQRMWDVIRGLVGDGTTVLLTTQYLDEADALADAHLGDRPRPRHRRGHAARAQGAHRWRAARGHARRRRTPGPSSALAPLVDRSRSQVIDGGRRLRGAGRRRAGARHRRRSARSTTPASRSTTSRSTARRSTTCSSPSPATPPSGRDRRRPTTSTDTDELDGGPDMSARPSTRRRRPRSAVTAAPARASGCATSRRSPAATSSTCAASRRSSPTSPIQPVLFTLLFVYIFGAAMVLPGGGATRSSPSPAC